VSRSRVQCTVQFILYVSSDDTTHYDRLCFATVTVRLSADYRTHVGSAIPMLNTTEKLERRANMLLATIAITRSVRRRQKLLRSVEGRD
jgi:hypothetical protein